MFTVICCMFGGIGFGWLLRKQNCSWIQKIITLLIWVLLFLLGIEVGGNKKICTVKIRCVNGNEFNLNGPLRKSAYGRSACNFLVGIFRFSVIRMRYFP